MRSGNRRWPGVSRSTRARHLINFRTGHPDGTGRPTADRDGLETQDHEDPPIALLHDVHRAILAEIAPRDGILANLGRGRDGDSPAAQGSDSTLEIRARRGARRRNEGPRRGILRTLLGHGTPL